jgi:putative ABC transport system substrate-binding protein
MNRRELLIAAGGLLGSTLARSQGGRRPYRIGLLVSPDAVGWFVAAMKDRGWIEGRDYLLVQSGIPYSARQAEDAAKRIVSERPDLIVVGSTAFALAAHRQTSTIPIVMWVSGYPVEVGLAHSLRKPGKNVTGNSIYAGIGIWGKMVQILRDAKPAAKRVGVLWGYAPPAFLSEEIAPGQQEIRKAASALGLATQLNEYGKPRCWHPSRNSSATALTCSSSPAAPRSAITGRKRSNCASPSACR